MLGKLKSILFDPHPIRTIAKSVMRRAQLGTYEERLRVGAEDRPHYGHIVYNAASLAQKLGLKRISVLEFGVAGGNGLLSLEYHARQAFRRFAVEIDIYGFDTSEGLPAPVDYRDLPYHWKQGFFKMDVDKLKSRLSKAQLVLGNIKDTAPSFLEKYKPAPIGAIAYDLDFYSSTAAALSILGSGEQHYLPRIFCYFDDVIGTDIALYSDYTGVRLAIHEFNQAHEDIKMALPYYFNAQSVMEAWHHQIWICHLFRHSCYTEFVSEENQMLPL